MIASRTYLLVVGVTVLTVASVRGQETGLAAKYPKDAGIGRDQAVLLHDDFEDGKIGAKWDEISRRKGRGATDGAEPVQEEKDPAIARGTRLARVQLNKAGHEDVTFVKSLRPGYDELYMRHYVRYGKDYGYHGHGGSGFMADAGKGGFKGAGKAPEGDKFFWAALEPIGRGRWDPPGALIFYSYWWKMKPDGRGNHWGNWFQPKPDQVPKLETWTCVEWRVKTNTAGQEDGELDCWVDGKKCGEFRKINWRSVDTLKVNKVQLSLWLEPASYERSGGGTTRTVWYDDVVVATKYIGPKVAKAEDLPKNEKKQLAVPPLRAVEHGYVVARTQNPAFHANTIFTAPEDLTSPRFAGLAERYKLRDVVKDEPDEFKRLLLLRHWLNRHIVIDRNKPAVEGDTLKMLEEGPKGGRYSCGHLEAMQNVILNAMGYVTRCVLSAPDSTDPKLSGSHGSNEVWCNSLCKWVLLDAEYDSHFETKDGTPLSALEVRDAYLADGAAGVVRVQGVERKPVPNGKVDQWGLTPKAYAFVSWREQADRHTIWPKPGSSAEIVYEDEHWRTHFWYRGGKKHWAYGAGAFRPQKDKWAIYWTPNVLDVKTRIHGATAQVDIESCTPNLKEYQMKRTGGEWGRVGKSFELELSRPREEWLLRSVNLAEVAGPEYRLVIERR